MEETNEVAVQPTQESSASTEKTTTDLEPRMKEDFFRHKEMMKKAQSEAEQLRERLKQYEMTEEEKKGNYSKVIDELKEKTRTLETTLKQKDYNYARNNIRGAVTNQAIKLGCKNVDAFIRLMGEDSFDVVTLDDAYNPEARDIEMIVQDNMKKYEDIGLFSRSVNVVDKSPDNNPRSTRSPKSISDLTAEELKDRVMNLKGVKRLQDL